MSAYYCRTMGPPDTKQAEKQKRWPAECIVCLRERKVSVFAADRAGAVAHREKEHRWLADVLRGKVKRLPVKTGAT